mgnify:CR=1 FL=1
MNLYFLSFLQLLSPDLWNFLVRVPIGAISRIRPTSRLNHLKKAMVTLSHSLIRIFCRVIRILFWLLTKLFILNRKNSL